MNEFLNSKLVQDLRDVINKTDIFIKDPIEKEKFNLICAIMDRFDSSINFLNENQTFPKSENEFINFLVHVSIIRDGINKVFEVLGLKIKNDNKIFEQYYKRDLPNINKEINELNTPSVKPISIISLMSPSPSDSFLNIFVVIIFSKYININIKAPDSIWLKNELTPKNFK